MHFRFRLERVLGVRRIEEQVARAAWLEAERPAALAEAEALALQTAIQTAREQLAQLQSSSRLGAADVLIKQALVDRLREQWVQKTIAASRLRKQAERLRLAMAERRVRVRGLKTLRSRAQELWRLESEASANAELDERAAGRREHARPAGSRKEHDERSRKGAVNPS
jgi:flagellar biosynthesis chaperone FliJ